MIPQVNWVKLGYEFVCTDNVIFWKLDLENQNKESGGTKIKLVKKKKNFEHFHL